MTSSDVIRPLPLNVVRVAGDILNGEVRAEFLALHVEAYRLHTAATELRREAWRLYHQRDREYSRYA